MAMYIVVYLLLGVTLLVVIGGIYFLPKLFQKNIDRLGKQLEEKFNFTQQNLLNTHKDFLEALARIYKDLGSLGEISKNLLDTATSFESIFQRPLARGGIGEAILENLAKDILPPDKFHTQYTFRNGKKVDLAIFLPQGILCIDSKFTLDSFNNFAQASGKEQEQLRRVFMRSVKTRIDETSSYINPQEQTLDFALMYVPSEQVYYEIISDKDLIEYAQNKKVFIVSPSSFYLYLKTVMIGFEGLRIEQEARRMLDYIKQIRVEFAKAESSFAVLGGHIKNAVAKYEETVSVLERLKRKIEGVLKSDAV